MKKISFMMFKRYCSNVYRNEWYDLIVCKVLPSNKDKCTAKNCPVFKKLKEAKQ